MAKALPPIGERKPDVLELEQFWQYQGNVYCFRPVCDDCRWYPGCKWEEAQVKVGPGINIRRAFRAQPGFKIVSIDYKGIELRVAAQLSSEPIWVEAFQNDEDLHQKMAIIAFKTPSPTKEQRDRAKTCVI